MYSCTLSRDRWFISINTSSSSCISALKTRVCCPLPCCFKFLFHRRQKDVVGLPASPPTGVHSPRPTHQNNFSGRLTYLFYEYPMPKQKSLAWMQIPLLSEVLKCFTFSHHPALGFWQNVKNFTWIFTTNLTHLSLISNKWLHLISPWRHLLFFSL